MNIFELIKRDHEEIDGLLVRLRRPPGTADFDQAGRQYLVDRLVAVASRHEAAEELVFWPAVRGHLAGGSDLADEALQAERDAKAVLDLLRVVDSESEIVDTCAELHAVLRAHAFFEEETVFPQLHHHTTRMWAALAGIRFRIARRGGPTRPHPNGPDQPAGLLTRGAPALVYCS